MRTDVDERAIEIAEYLIRTGDTVRGAAGRFGLSKSTIHKYMTERLEQLHPGLHRQVRQVLDLNKAERHLRGGEATKRKYAPEE